MVKVPPYLLKRGLWQSILIARKRYVLERSQERVNSRSDLESAVLLVTLTISLSGCEIERNTPSALSLREHERHDETVLALDTRVRPGTIS